MSKFDRLRAKSGLPSEPAPDSVFLVGHLRDVYEAAGHVLDCTADDQLRVLGLRPSEWVEKLRRAVLLAAAVHDLGKANDHFQEMLDRKRTLQGLRHEWVTLLMLQQPGWQEWLGPWLCEPADWDFVLWSVSGHHPAFNRPSPPKAVASGAGSEVVLLQGHEDFAECLDWLQETFRLAPPPPCADRKLSLVGSDGAFTQIARAHQRAVRQWSALPDAAKRFAAAVKNCLIAGDVAGSALPKQGVGQAGQGAWIRGGFARIPTPQQLRQIVLRRLDGRALRPFQREVAERAGRVSFVRAGCGTGKTLLAYHWASERCAGKRLYFCYPTTGTATEGFRDYLHNPEEDFGAELFHGRAGVDLDIILNVRSDSEHGDPRAEAEAEAAADAAVRVESLDAWSTPIVSCTVDTVLGLVQNNRRGLYSWPALAGAAFVFDEIHAYDDELFGALLRFLQAFQGAPILLMTASLPDGRLQALRHCLQRQGESLTEIAGPADLEQLPRYLRQTPADPTDPLPEVREEIARGGKVLWVCNTVGRAMTAAERASDLHPLIYHSRFRYEDRVRQHKNVIDRFKEASRPALAVCTQVAEMSLDLSATLLVTDIAPVPALIQRLGRLNRKAVPPIPGRPPPEVNPLIVVEPTRSDGSVEVLPYSAEEFVLARTWLDALGGGPLSQKDLAETWQSQDAGRRTPAVFSAWLDGGPSTTVLPLRKGTPGITVVLSEDVPALRSGAQALARVALPMPLPKRFDWKNWKDFQGVPIAPAGTVSYHPERGARWQN
jgi:CRISPR-associated endonuclease/helicase Cas3